nr:pyridoxamine 5'-phosphate oxidase family protein [uncultured Agathobaculum sp.]
MNAQKCLEILREIKDCTFSTVDAFGAPCARIIDVMLVEAGALYFCTARGKSFHAQLERDGRVAITGLNSNWQTVRLTGRARRLANSREWIDRIFAANVSMNSIYPGESRYILDAYVIDSGKIEFFDLGVSPIYRESFTLGEAKVEPKGFHITGDCIGCSLCARCCPQQCIRPGEPYEIEQAHCLHCGLCFENCPAGAIVRREETK